MARCICCKTELDNITEEEIGLQPVNGLAFESHGHYGTTVFDPMNGSKIAVAICDACITRASHEGDVLIKISGQQKWKTWDVDAYNNDD
jgi:hypothetical protein